MRICMCLMAILPACLAQSIPSAITGMWVADRYSAPSVGAWSKLVLEVKPLGPGELCVWRFSADLDGQHIERRQYELAVKIRDASLLPAAVECF